MAESVDVAKMLLRLGTGQQMVRWSARMYVAVNGEAAHLNTPLDAGDILTLGEDRFRIVKGLEGFLYPAILPAQCIQGRVNVHCGLHKSLTMFTRRVYDGAIRAQQLSPWQIVTSGRWPQQRHHFHFVRDKALGQWRKVLPDALNRQVIDDYGAILRAYDYPLN